MALRIALLGIDGSGKSTLARGLKEKFEKRGHNVKIVPFHYWVFADKLKEGFWKQIDSGRTTLKVPFRPQKKSLSIILKPIIALLDNILFYIMNQPNTDYDIIIFDRFICATMIKMKALGYYVEWLRPIWNNFKPDIAIIIDISEELSIQRQVKRGDSSIYYHQELSIERKEYITYAKSHGFVIIDGNREEQAKNIDAISTLIYNNL